MNFHIVIKADKDSHWAGGTFYIKASIPDEFPIEKPDFKWVCSDKYR